MYVTTNLDAIARGDAKIGADIGIESFANHWSPEVAELVKPFAFISKAEQAEVKNGCRHLGRDHHPVSTAALGLIERLVSSKQQGIHRAAVHRELCQTDGNRHGSKVLSRRT